MGGWAGREVAVGRVAALRWPAPLAFLALWSFYTLVVLRYVHCCGRGFTFIRGGYVDKEWMNAREVSKRLGITVSAVHRLCNRGTLASVRCGWCRLFRWEAVEALVANGGYQSRSRRKATMKELEDGGQIRLAVAYLQKGARASERDG